jgi:hypothetical protein
MLEKLKCQVQKEGKRAKKFNVFVNKRERSKQIPLKRQEKSRLQDQENEQASEY